MGLEDKDVSPSLSLTHKKTKLRSNGRRRPSERGGDGEGEGDYLDDLDDSEFALYNDMFEDGSYAY